MDNISHTLAGVIAAEAVIAGLKRRGIEPSQRFTRAARVTSAVANNFPDLDFVYTSITGGNLGYLLHHRGHTHTLLLGLPFTLLALLIPWFMQRRRGMAERWSAGEWRWLAVLTVVGALLHLSLDSTNNYGVHPFWPFDNRWFYGDTIFIIEPLFWVIGIPLLLHSFRSRIAKGVWGFLLIAILTAAWVLPFVPNAICVGLTITAAALFGVSRRWRAETRAATIVLASLTVVFIFGVMGQRVKARVGQSAAEAFPTWRVHDVVATPLPSNPLCWETTTVMTSEAEDGYAVRRAQVAPTSLVYPAACTSMQLRTSGTAQLTPIETADRSGPVVWRDAYVASLTEFRKVAAHCEAAALLRFARVPFLATGEGGETIIGDLRFDREPGLSFAELRLSERESCPKFVPSWTPPREEIFQ